MHASLSLCIEIPHIKQEKGNGYYFCQASFACRSIYPLTAQSAIKADHTVDIIIIIIIKMYYISFYIILSQV